MAKRRRTRRTQDALSADSGPTLDTSPQTDIAPTDSLQPQNRIKRGATKRLTDWAISKALDFIWVGVVAVMGAPTVAIWIYFRSGRATWTYPWLYAALGFIAACFVLIFASAFLIYVKARRLKAAEGAKSLKFVSREKGFLDHIKNQRRGFKEFNSILPAMGDEVTKIGKASARAGTQMKVARMILGTNSAGIVFWIASRTAKKLNKHSRKLEQQLAKLEKTTDLLIESNVGYLTWFSPSTEQEQQKLASDRTALIRLLDITRNATKTMQEFRDSQDSTKGISQELNTALNIMSHVTEGIVAFLRKADKHWQELIEIIDNKNTA